MIYPAYPIQGLNPFPILRYNVQGINIVGKQKVGVVRIHVRNKPASGGPLAVLQNQEAVISNF